MEKLKKRKELDRCDCWDLEKIIRNDAEYENLKKIAKEKCEELEKMKGKILLDEKTLAKFMQIDEDLSRTCDKLLVYTKFLYDEDTTIDESRKKMLEVESLLQHISEKESFVMPELMQKDLDDVLSLLDKDDSLKKYTRYFKEIYKDKERILSEKEEALLSKVSTIFGNSEDSFDALDVSDALFEPIVIDGKEVPLTHYNYIELLEHEDQEVRKNAFLNYHKFYKEHKNTFASFLKGNYQELEFTRSIRNYPSSLEMALDGIHVKKEVYENLIESVHKYMDLNVNFQKLKAKMLGNKEYHLYDTYVSVIKTPKKKFTKEEAIALVIDALEPMNDDYITHFKSILESKTVDFYPNVGKHNGAYQWGCFDTDSYVLLNFNGTLDSVSTLAHEMGHAVHSMYSKENNEYVYYGYEIFLAEIASTVNEMLLSDYCLKMATTKEEKIYYLCEFLDKVKGTIYRQTMFSEFEQLMSEKCFNKESLTEKLFSDTYYELNKQYFKDSVIIDDDIRYEEYRVSHFYRPFYVYQYATGLICAIKIVRDILNGINVEKYIEFLKSGSSKNVLDILKIVDIDLTTKEPFESAFSFIESRLKELEQLVSEVENHE